MGPVESFGMKHILNQQRSTIGKRENPVGATSPKSFVVVRSVCTDVHCCSLNFGVAKVPHVYVISEGANDESPKSVNGILAGQQSHDLSVWRSKDVIEAGGSSHVYNESATATFRRNKSSKNMIDMSEGSLAVSLGLFLR